MLGHGGHGPCQLIPQDPCGPGRRCRHRCPRRGGGGDLPDDLRVHGQPPLRGLPAPSGHPGHEPIGPAFEYHPLFPERVNTEFVQVVNRNTLKMRVWERGSGETWACGTGACAAAAAARTATAILAAM
ncbi:MAG: hypothetical protein V8T45_01580 [Oscillospiraceae bacterium]